jgi:predicted regulator of amino acid metabolism with ACT domain
MNVCVEPAVEQLIDLLTSRRERPVYFQINEGKSGKLECRQVEFITPEQFAELRKVDRRTVYSWIDKANEVGKDPLEFVPPIYSQAHARGIVFDLHEAVLWIKGQLEPNRKPS